MIMICINYPKCTRLLQVECQSGLTITLDRQSKSALST